MTSAEEMNLVKPLEMKILIGRIQMVFSKPKITLRRIHMMHIVLQMLGMILLCPKYPKMKTEMQI